MQKWIDTNIVLTCIVLGVQTGKKQKLSCKMNKVSLSVMSWLDVYVLPQTNEIVSFLSTFTVTK